MRSLLAEGETHFAVLGVSLDLRVPFFLSLSLSIVLQIMAGTYASEVNWIALLGAGSPFVPPSASG